MRSMVEGYQRLKGILDLRTPPSGLRPATSPRRGGFEKGYPLLARAAPILSRKALSLMKPAASRWS
jgi:hypothetical protein